MKRLNGKSCWALIAVAAFAAPAFADECQSCKPKFKFGHSSASGKWTGEGRRDYSSLIHNHDQTSPSFLSLGQQHSYNGVYRNYGQPDLFRQYYSNNVGGATAELYLAPIPVPPHVGHTYYTYEPLYPHEMLYRHVRNYHRYYDDGRGMTRTHVRWAW